MKRKILALLFVGVLCFSFAACGEDDVKSVLGNETAEESEEEYQFEIPDAIINISPEDDKAITGVLTEDSYTNEYFGLKFNKIEGGTIESLLDDGTDLALLSETYANEIGSIIINSTGADTACHFSVTVSAVLSKQQGKTEEELVQNRFEMEQGINETLEYDAECSVENISLGGEEHPAYVEISDLDGIKMKDASFYLIKNDFECDIFINAPAEKFDGILKLIEKI